MSSSLERLKALTSRLEEKLEKKDTNFTTNKISKKETINNEVLIAKTPIKEVIEVEEPIIENRTSNKDTDAQINTDNNAEDIRSNNISLVKNLYEELKIFEKSPDFSNIFMYKAMNLSGISLKEEDFGEVREGKYIQIIAITYEPDKNGKKKAKNISLGYFGKADTLEFTLKNEIIEFVLRWRYEKAFQNVEHYKELIEKIEKPIININK